MVLPKASVLGYEEVVSRIGNPEEIIAAVLVKMDEGVEGLVLFLLNLEFTSTVFGRLVGESFSDFAELDRISCSALAEMRDIITCPYINAFSQLVGVEMELPAPNATVSMLRGMLTVPIVEYGHETDKLVYSNVNSVMEGKKLPGWLFMFPDIDSLDRILDKLGVL